MDDISRCKNQLASFRIKELKDVLTRLGLPKQGKKQVLMDKIMAVLIPADWQPHTQKVKSGSLRSSVSREDAGKVIDDIYRKLRGLGSAVELATVPRNVSAVSVSAARSDEQDEANTWELRCPCGSSQELGTSIQCENQACNVWQHLNCVVISENTANGAEPEVPSQFYCEMCRIGFADPYCVTISQSLLPVKFFAPPGLKMEGTSPLHCMDKTFTLTKADRDLLHKPNHDLQVWCLLLNDKVPYRMHWPTYADLRVNGVSVRVSARTGTQLLGANGRDDGPGVTTCTREGPNKISLQACDARPFCIGIRIIRRLTVDQVMNLIPSVSDGEPLAEALSRVNRCINGGAAEAGDGGGDDDSDLEVVADSVTFNLSCPMSGSRINMAGRFKPCAHMGGFDLRTFVEMQQRTRKWQCPVCMKNYTLEQVIVDPFFNRIAHAMKGYNEDVKVVELKTDGFWRPKLEGEARNKEPWRNPDGSFVLVNGTHKPGAVKLEEGASQERKPLKIGIKRGQDGTWAVNRSSKNPAPRRKEPSFSRSSSATDSNEDDDRSVNQEPYADEYTADNEARVPNRKRSGWKKNKISTQPAPAPAPVVQPAAANGNAGGDLIVLSDSDEESGSPAGLSNRKLQQQRGGLANGGGLDRLDSTSAYWSQQQHQQQQPPYRFFDSNPADASEYNVSDYGAAYMDEEDDLGASKSGFRLFLPPQPTREHHNVHHQHQHQHQQQQQQQHRQEQERDEELDDTWFSLSLGGGGDNADYSRAADGRDSIANTAASVLLGLNNNNNINNNPNNRAGPSRRPRQQQQQQRSFYHRLDQSDGSD